MKAVCNILAIGKPAARLNDKPQAPDLRHDDRLSLKFPPLINDFPSLPTVGVLSGSIRLRLSHL